MKTLVAPALALFLLAGCAGIQPGNDPVVVNAERTTATALEAFDGFLRWEYEHRAALAALPYVRICADKIRAEGVQWLQSARTLTQIYKGERSTENLTRLQRALGLLSAAVAEAEKYMATANPLRTP